MADGTFVPPFAPAGRHRHEGGGHGGMARGIDRAEPSAFGFDIGQHQPQRGGIDGIRLGRRHGGGCAHRPMCPSSTLPRPDSACLGAPE